MNAQSDMRSVFSRVVDAFAEGMHAHDLQLTAEETGRVLSVGQGVARVRGLPGVRSEELILFSGGLPGVAFNLDPDEIGVILLGESNHVVAGSEVSRTGRILDVPVGRGLLGRVIDAAGNPLDGGGPLGFLERRPVERDSPAILDRAPVITPLQTGLKAVDALLPIGRGQRELILGDRQTGKTSVALDTIINQKGNGVICVYCAVGRRSSATARLIADLRRHEALDHTIVMVAGGETPPGLQYITPYAATTVAEYFMEQGNDVLIVYDDLTQHARAYRELSLLLRRPPGREAFPGDIFFVHSRLLERSTHLRAELGGGSLTALPIAETEAENLSAYIPTNLISITDGQIYLSPGLFQKGLLPAVDIGRSVSRVGGKAQLPAYRSITGPLRLTYSQFEELEAFSRFGTRLDEETTLTLERGRRVRQVLTQPQYEPIPAAEQLTALLAVTAGVFDDLKAEEIPAAEPYVRRRTVEALPDVVRRIESGERLNQDDHEALREAARKALREWMEGEEKHADA